jgi:hypothetical protein
VLIEQIDYLSKAEIRDNTIRRRAREAENRPSSDQDGGQASAR